jgi:hypothetical protein
MSQPDCCWQETLPGKTPGALLVKTQSALGCAFQPTL